MAAIGTPKHLAPPGCTATIVDQYVDGGNLICTVDVTVRRWRPAYWLWRLRLRCARVITINV